jgi:phage gpG-like protein
MAAVSFKLTRNDISPALARMAAAARNPTAVFRAMGTTFMSLTMGNFKSTAYRPSAWKAKRDGAPSNLQKAGELSRSFHLEVTSHSATVSSPKVYAAIHQFGGTIKGNPWLRFQYAPGQWATVAQVTISARPFFPVEASGERLTAKAEERIAAAGRRAIERQIKG